MDTVFGLHAQRFLKRVQYIYNRTHLIHFYCKQQGISEQNLKPSPKGTFT